MLQAQKSFYNSHFQIDMRKKTDTKVVSVFFNCVSGMAHILSVKVRSQVFVAKCSEPQAESREAGVKEAV